MINILKNYFIAHHIPFKETHNQLITKDLLCVFKKKALIFYSQVSSPLSPQETMDYLMEVNLYTGYGHFDYDIDKNIIYYRLTLDLDSRPLTPRLIEAALAGIQYDMTTYLNQEKLKKES